MSEVIAGIRIPDSKLAREATDLLREYGKGLPIVFLAINDYLIAI
jgi:hypothetical protein